MVRNDLLPKLDGRVDFMKIDVEGCEPLAFRGAKELIASNRQLKIVMEWSPGQIRSAGFDVPARTRARHLAAERVDVLRHPRLWLLCGRGGRQSGE